MAGVTKVFKHVEALDTTISWGFTASASALLRCVLPETSTLGSGNAILGRVYVAVARGTDNERKAERTLEGLTVEVALLDWPCRHSGGRREVMQKPPLYPWPTATALPLHDRRDLMQKPLPYPWTTGMREIMQKPLLYPWTTGTLQLSLGTYSKTKILVQKKQTLAMIQFTRWQKAHEAMENHRTNYRWMLNTHRRGRDPGIPGWTLQWTDEDFDREYLRHAMGLSTEVRTAQNFVDDIVALCAEFGIEALPWQDQDFPDVESPHYPLSWEQEAIDEAPREAIQRWADGLPENEKELGGSRGVFDPDHNPARYAGDHIIEWPPDMDIAVDRDVEPWDSFSCHAINIHETTHRFHRMAALQLSEPPSWTWSEDTHHRPESNNLRLLQSHMC
ncbi:hypothetical protein LTR37_009613 [Vermiconidia calcicola]|uniref:Uncharacterized protein n=1 Tax=Vermiconidia calcicola TaxID=1690605 RepID=A0ACC3N8F7_9PEZI|nr:hypothetical protein LTR37_009613 [Vermiconidia calcicola]